MKRVRIVCTVLPAIVRRPTAIAYCRSARNPCPGLLLVSLLAVLSPVTASAQTRILDDFSSVSRWEAHPSEGVDLAISKDKGKVGPAMRLDFDFRTGGGYGIARLPLALDLPGNYEFSFLLRGETPVNTLEFKLLGPTGENVWWSVRRRYRFPSEWTRIRIKKRNLTFAWGPRGGGEIEKISGLEIVVTAADGGRGTIWIDELTFTPLEPERPYDLKPSVSASSSSPSHPPSNAIEGGSASRWRSAGPAPQALTIDFLRRRETGGLKITWGSADYATDYDVQLSDDGKTWDTVWRARGGDGGSDWVFLPEGEGRYLRLNLIRSAGREFEIADIEVQEAEFGDSRNAMYEHIARESRRGLYPRYLSGEQSYWTIVGAPFDTGEALINQEGTIDIDPIRFSLDPFLWVVDPAGNSGRLLTWSDASRITQSLADDELPIPSVRRDHGELHLSVTAFARGEEGHSVLWIRYRVTNDANAPRTTRLCVAIRPLQVNPTWQSLAVVGGSTEVRRIARKAEGVVINDTTTVVPLTEMDAFGAERFDQGDVAAGLARGVLPERNSVDDPFGAASAVMAWDLTVPPNGSEDVVVTVPFHERPAYLDGSLGRSLAAEIAEKELAVARTEWASRLGRVAIHLPPAAAGIERAIRSNLAYILINMDGPSIQPGSRSYDRSWIRDGSLTSAALLRLGHPEEVKRFIEWYSTFQRENGYVPCCVGRRGGDPVPENDSHGQFIYLVREYYEFTGDRSLLERMWPHVEKAVRYIDSLRHERMTPEYRQSDKKAFFGLVPESISHEGYSAKPMHSYWDDFFTLKGLKDATEIARILGHEEKVRDYSAMGDEFRTALYHSISAAMNAHHIDYIPGSVELGDFDATSTTIAVNPAGELGKIPEPALHDTFDRYWKDFLARKDGTAAWDRFTPYEWRVVGTFVRLGEPERAIEAMNWFLDYSRPPQWNHWAEVVHHDPSTPKFIGDMPHTWVGSDFIRSVLDMFAYERDSDQALVIASGVPRDWIMSDEGVSVEMLRTPYGPLSYSLRHEGGTVAAHIDEGLEIPPGGLVLVSPIDRKETVIRKLPADIHLGR